MLQLRIILPETGAFIGYIYLPIDYPIFMAQLVCQEQGVDAEIVDTIPEARLHGVAASRVG